MRAAAKRGGRPRDTRPPARRVPPIQGIVTVHAREFRAKVARGGTVRALATCPRTLHAREIDIGAVRAYGRQGGDGLMVDMAVLVLIRVDVIGKKITLVDNLSYKVVKNASGQQIMLLW